MNSKSFIFGSEFISSSLKKGNQIQTWSFHCLPDASLVCCYMFLLAASRPFCSSRTRILLNFAKLLTEMLDYLVKFGKIRVFRERNSPQPFRAELSWDVMWCDVPSWYGVMWLDSTQPSVYLSVLCYAMYRSELLRNDFLSWRDVAFVAMTALCHIAFLCIALCHAELHHCA